MVLYARDCSYLLVKKVKKQQQKFTFAMEISLQELDIATLFINHIIKTMKKTKKEEKKKKYTIFGLEISCLD